MPSERFRIRLDGREVEAEAGWTVAVAARNAGLPALRRSLAGAPRGPLCAMGICFECRVAIDGRSGVRACLEPCRPGMRVETGLASTAPAGRR